MSIKKLNHRKIILVYSIFNLVMSILVIMYFFSQPSEVEVAIFLGFSLARLSIGAIVFAGILFWGWLIYSFYVARKENTITLSSQIRNFIIFSALVFLLIGFVTLFTNISGTSGYVANYLIRIFPLSIWAIGVGFTSMAVIITLTSNTVRKDFIALFVYIGLLSIGSWVSVTVWPAKTSMTEDIFFPYQEGTRIISGINPYTRIILEGYRDDGKYPIYFAGFYLLSGLSQKVGFSGFEQWISLWKLIFLFFSLAIGTTLYYLPYKKNLILMSVFSMAFWLLNRWTIHLYRVSEMDFIPIFFLILSLALLSDHPKLSFLTFGLSLCFKQIGVFLVPIYLYWAWTSTKGVSRITNFVFNLLLIALMPLITTGPFIVWDLKGFSESMLVSLNRAPAALDNLYSVSAFMNWSGFTGSLPMGLMFITAVVLSISYRLGPFRASLAILLVYIGFNTAMFPSNFLWVIPLLPLSISESMIPKQPSTNHNHLNE